jgi:hypothetical protein
MLKERKYIVSIYIETEKGREREKETEEFHLKMLSVA